MISWIRVSASFLPFYGPLEFASEADGTKTVTLGKDYSIKVKVKSLSPVQLFAVPWTVVYQASLSMGFSRQEYWSGLPFPSPGDLPNPGVEPRSPALQADALPSKPPGKPLSNIMLRKTPAQQDDICTI